MINDILKVGDKIKISYMKNPLTVTEVGKINGIATGARGGKYDIYWRGYDQKIICCDEVINLTMSHYQMKTSSLDHIKPNTLFAAKSMTANGVTV
jgi:hypothetical protein